MNRLRARVFSLLAALAVTCALVAPARAQDATVPLFWFAGTRLIFERAIPLDGDVAVSIRDSGLQRFLTKLGATLSYQPQQRYILITAADHRTIAFTIGAAQYSAGGVTARGAFAPFVDANEPIVPLYAIAHALYVEPVAGAGETILQPQIGALDIRTQAGRTTVVVRGATALAYVKRVDTPTHVEFVFGGLSSTLSGSRKVGAGVTATITPGGSARNPATVLALDAPRGFSYDVAPPLSPYELSLAIVPGDADATSAYNPPAAPAANAPSLPAPATAAPAFIPPPPPALGGASAPMPLAATAGEATPVPVNGPARLAVATVTLQLLDDGLTIHVAVDGAATYDWHRLADQRWYIDLHGAQLTDAGRDEHPSSAAVDSVRIRQIGSADAPVVRIALTMRGEKEIDVIPTANGITIGATNIDAIASARTGAGRIGSAAVAGTYAPGGYPQPLATPLALATPWKFGVATPGSRIIVLDPGHGGGDMGTAHNGLVEKTLTIDIARRLRTLLTAAGWTVRMTRDSDIDPVTQANLASMAADGKPNPSDRAYLQTRCDVANNVNARMFISIHVNYSDSPAVNGTTFYWYKPQDQALAQTLEKATIPVAGTSDDGPKHENFYVIRHTTMPAVLIETAFISNPHDAALLGSPAFLQNMAQGIANGVRAYASAPVQSPRADQ